MASNSVKTKHNGRKLRELATRLGDGQTLQIGVFDSAKPYQDGTSVADVAKWNEYGTDTIPERPFLRNTMRENQEEYTKLVIAFIRNLILARVTRSRAIGTIGTKVKTDIVKTIDEFNDPPNAESTIARKGKDDPLVDSGHLMRSIDWRLK